MFSVVARRYDRANHLLSAGIDRLWRRSAVRMAGIERGERVLDACAGTGDLSIAIARHGASVVAADFCPQMLAQTPGKASDLDVRCVVGDTMQLPFPDDSFDAATVAFGIRNVSDPVAGLRELARVVRPGGRVVVLEFTTPRLPIFRQAYLLYFQRVLPRLGAWISGTGDGAYDYLQRSVMRFPEYDEFLARMADAGLESSRMRVLTLGIATLYRAEVPAHPAGGGPRSLVGVAGPCAASEG